MYDEQMPLDQALRQFAPQQPAPQQYMPGTAAPTKTDQEMDLKALVAALRGGQQGTQSAAPQQYGRVTSSGAFGDGMDAKAIGGALKNTAGGISDWFNNTGNFAPADLAGTSFI